MRHLSFSNVIALLALFVALGGTAWALADNSVKSRHIDNGQVKTEDLDANAVTGGKIEPDAVKASDVNDDELTGDDVEDGTLGAGESDILPHGRMSLSTNQAISNNVVETVVMDREDYGSGVDFNFTANDSEIVIDTPGVYLVIGEILWIPNGTGSREVLLNKNSSNTLFFGESEMPAAQPPAFTKHRAVAIEPFESGDTVELRAVQTSGAELSTAINHGRTASLSVAWLGPLAP